MFSNTHASKNGAYLGLGITFIRYALLIPHDPIGYLLFISGVLLIIYANTEFFRILRLRNRSGVVVVNV